MGGYGSGWRRARTNVVEHCLVLSIADLIREGALVPGKITHGVLAWSRAGKEPHAQVTYEVDLRTEKHATIDLRYRIDNQSEGTHVWFSYTVPQFGGRRLWFSCPLTGSRTTKLYLPPGQTRFASRQAYSLAYSSSRRNQRTKSGEVHMKPTKHMLVIAKALRNLERKGLIEWRLDHQGKVCWYMTEKGRQDRQAQISKQLSTADVSREEIAL